MDLLNKTLSTIIRACCKAFSPMGQKALLKTFAQSHGIKTFAPFFREIKENFSGKTTIFREIDGKMPIWQKFRQFDEIFDLCKGFFPTGCCKGFLQ